MSWIGTGDIIPRIIVAFAAPAAVSTVTPLYALTELGNIYKDLTFTLRNHDLALKAALYIDTSESGVVTDDEPQQFIISPLKELKVTFRDILSLYWGLSASGDPDAGFASVNVSFQITGTLRYTLDSPR